MEENPNYLNLFSFYQNQVDLGGKEHLTKKCFSECPKQTVDEKKKNSFLFWSTKIDLYVTTTMRSHHDDNILYEL